MMVNARPWMQHGRCSSRADQWDELTTAEQVELCQTCPVIGTCFTWAIEVGMTHLVCGGHQFPTRPYRTAADKRSTHDRGHTE